MLPRPAPALVLLAVLAASLPGQATESPQDQVSLVREPARAHAIQESFQRSLRQLGFSARIESCSTPVGFTTPETGGRDSSFAATCVLALQGRQRTVTMCDDEMIGRFTLTESAGNTPNALADFIRANCPPGG